MGSLLPPVDIRESNQLNELDKRIQIGPITLVLIYADWCGHCKRFKPMMDQLENSPGRSVQVARVRDTVLPQSAVANIPNEGYPSLMLIKPDGSAVNFKNDEGKTTNVIPDHTNMVKMQTIVRNAGKPEGLNLLNGEIPSDPVEVVSPPTTGNISAPESLSMPSIPKNIVADRLPSKNIQQLNRGLTRSNNMMVKQTAGPVPSQLGGGLWGYMYGISQDLLPAAALLAASTALPGKRLRKSRRKTRSRRR